MTSPTIDKIRFRTSPFVPSSAASVNGETFKDIFRVLFEVTTPPELECTKWKIHVEIYEDDDLSPDDLITGSPFPLDYCYELKPGAKYTFYIGNVDPFGRAIPTGAKAAADLAQAGSALDGGAYTLPGYAPITFSGDPGDEYEFYAKAMLIPCECEDEDEVSLESKYQHSKQVGGKDVLEQILEWVEKLGSLGGSAASAATTGKP